jgi:hypothetical protein
MPPLRSRRQWALLPSSREVDSRTACAGRSACPDDRGRSRVSAPRRAERLDSRAHAVAPHAPLNTEREARGRRAKSPPWPSGDPRSTVERPRRLSKRTHIAVSHRPRGWRHERRGIHDARHLGWTLMYWPHLAGGFLTSDAPQQTTRGGLRTTARGHPRPPHWRECHRVRFLHVCWDNVRPPGDHQRPLGGRTTLSRNEECEKRRSPATLQSWTRKGPVGVDWPVASATFAG